MKIKWIFSNFPLIFNGIFFKIQIFQKNSYLISQAKWQTFEKVSRADSNPLPHSFRVKRIFEGKRDMSLFGWHFYHSLPAFLKGKHEKSRPSFEALASKKR